MRAEDVKATIIFWVPPKTGTEENFNLSLYKNQALLAQIAIQDHIKPETALT
jgi:Cu+-exporting ATPase